MTLLTKQQGSGQESRPFSIDPLSDILGGEVSNFDLRELQPGQSEDIKKLLRKYQVLAFHNQTLSPAELVDFVRLIGEPQYHVLKEWHLPGHPEIYVLSNIVENGRPIGNANEGYAWHTDFTGGIPQEKPTVYTVLQGLEVPETGGETTFASMYKAYESLPDARRDELDKMMLVYSYEALYNRRMKRLDAKGVKHNYAPLNEEQLAYAAKRQYFPLVNANPMTGRKWLRLTSGGCIGIEGMRDEDGVKLVADLIKYCTMEQFRQAYRWRAGDVLIWDNYGLFHLAGEYDRNKYQRLMYRCSVGEENFITTPA